VLVLDGSSVFAHGLPEDLITNELQKLGHHVCVISLSLPGADHFERECMAEDVLEHCRPRQHVSKFTPSGWCG